MSQTAPESANIADHSFDAKSDSEIPEQTGNTTYIGPNSSAEDAGRTTESGALLKFRLAGAGGDPRDYDVTMLHTR